MKKKPSIDDQYRKLARRLFEDDGEERFPGPLSKVDPNIAKKVVNAGLEDDDKSDDKVAAKNKASVPAGKLKPSQTEIVRGKALGMALGMILSNKFGGDLGAIISKDGFIMDGHHRWAATMLTKPGASVIGTIIGLNGETLVKVLNVVTKGMLGVQSGNEGKGAVKEFTGENIKNDLFKIIGVPDKEFKNWEGGDGADFYNSENKPEKKDAKFVRELLAKWAGGDIKKAIQTLMKNADAMPKQTPSWAVKRSDMPVINPDQVEAVAKKFIAGEIDIKEPYADLNKVEEGKKMSGKKLNELRATIGSIWPSGWMVSNVGSHEEPQSYDDYYDFADSNSKTIQDSMARFEIYEDEDWVNEMNKQLKLQKRKGDVSKSMFKEEDEKDERELLVDEEDQDEKGIEQSPWETGICPKCGSESLHFPEDSLDDDALWCEECGWSEFEDGLDWNEYIKNYGLGENLDINVGRVLKEAGFAMSPISSMGVVGGRYDYDEDFDDEEIDPHPYFDPETGYEYFEDEDEDDLADEFYDDEEVDIRSY